MKKTILCFGFIIFSRAYSSEPIIENSSWNASFSNQSVVGVFLLCENSANNCVTNDKQRAVKGFIPASTFKIPNSLIALETGVVTSEHQVFKWDGKPRAMKQWERDLTLRSAMQISAVPVYQQFAREIGEKRMQKYINKFSYGNRNIEGGIDQFWLDGQLRITAQQQAIFLKALYINDLPASKLNQLIVKQAMVTETKSDYIIYSKTGYSGAGTSANPGVAWWVGWVERGTEVYFFAFNMDVENEQQLSARKSIPITLLKSEGLLPDDL